MPTEPIPANAMKIRAGLRGSRRAERWFFGSMAVLIPLTVLIGFDLLTMGRIHRATVWGGLVILISQPLRLAISGTDAWLSFAHWAVALVA
jgi:hypothetical protein